MKNEFKNKSVSALVLLVVAISCAGILQYLWTQSNKDENAPKVEAAVQDPEFDPDEQDTEDMIYVGTFRLESPEEFVETPVAPPNVDDTPFYVFDNDGFGENKVRGQMYGTQDKIGIERTVWVLTKNRVADFEFIRDHSAARDAFALQHTGVARSNARHWRVGVYDLRNDQIEVLASRGCDDNADGIGHEDAISERWQLNAIGTNPTLLERTYDNVTLP